MASRPRQGDEPPGLVVGPLTPILTRRTYDGRVTFPLPDLVLYTRPGCHLCEEARDIVQAVLEDRAAHGLPLPRVVERNIEDDPELHRQYLERIPVLELEGRHLELILSFGKVRRMLADVLDGATLV
jgi:hypothetical protein